MNNFNQTYKEWLEQSAQKKEDIKKRRVLPTQIIQSGNSNNTAPTRRKQDQTQLSSPTILVPPLKSEMKNTASSSETSIKIELLTPSHSLTSSKTEIHTNSSSETLSAGECRACLQILNPSMRVHCLFTAWDTPWKGMGTTIAEDLSNIANIPLSETDIHSKLICDTCLVSLKNSCTFVVAVRNNDLALRTRYTHPPTEINISSETVWPKPIQVDTSYNNTIDIKQEVLSDEEYSDLNTVEDLKPVDDIKIEPEEIVEQTPSHYSHLTVNGDFPLNELYEDNTMQQNGSNGSDTFEEEEYLDSAVKTEPPNEEEDDTETVPSDLPLECMLCTKQFKSVSGLKAHVIAQHSYVAVKRKTAHDSSTDGKKKKTDKYICARCRRCFTTSTELMVHETCHNKQVCYSCNKMFDTFSQLSEHIAHCSVVNNKPAIKPKTLEDVKRLPIQESKLLDNDEDELPKETLECSLCGEKFSDAYYMKIHQEIHHSASAEQESSESTSQGMEIETLESIFKDDK